MQERYYPWRTVTEAVDPALERAARLSLLCGVLAWTALPIVGAVLAIVLGRRVLHALPPSLTRRGKGWWTARHARGGMILGGLQLTMLGVMLVLAVAAQVATFLLPPLT